MRRPANAPDAADGSHDPRGRALGEPTPAELLEAVRRGWAPAETIPRVLALLESDPLASAGRHPGDLLRTLMDVPARCWSGHPRLYARYREVLRAGALARRALPPDRRLDFWLGHVDG